MADEPQIPVFAWLSTRHYTARQRIALDLLVILVLGMLASPLITHQQPRVHGELWTILGWASAVFGSILFLLRRRYPWAVLLLMMIPALLGIALRAHDPAFFYLMLTLYTVVSRSSQPTGALAAVGIAAFDLPATLGSGGNAEESGASVVIGSLALIALAWLAGYNSRQTRLAVERRREEVRAAALAAEADREERTRRKIADERVLIARELHDIVAHTMSVIAVRAGVGRMVLGSRPDEAEEALKIIETTARTSLSEMRLMVQILRSGGADKPDLGPLPGLDDLPQLVQQVRIAGVAADITVEGRRRDLPALADLSAYRIVQEALTNVVRHAGPTRAHVRIAFLSEQLEIDVRDEGTSAAVRADPPGFGSGEGHGIVGMRERAALFGGVLAAGPVAGGGYRVSTRLNIDVTPQLSSMLEAAHG